MKIDEKFIDYLSQINFATHGDNEERLHGSRFLDTFPNVEMFWRLFVVPFTERVSNYPDKPSSSIKVRDNIDILLEEIGNTHYSIFVNLAQAHTHLQTKMFSSFENIYVSLGSVCDLTETFFSKLYILFCKCQNIKPSIKDSLTKSEFLEEMSQEYDRAYPKWEKRHLKKGAGLVFRYFQPSDTMVSYLGSKNDRRIEYEKKSDAIRAMRNTIVHDVKIARIITIDGHALVPKTTRINSYRSWKKVEEASHHPETVKADFIERYAQASEDISSFETVLNFLWDYVIANFTKEILSSERDFLRKLYDFQLIDANTPLFKSAHPKEMVRPMILSEIESLPEGDASTTDISPSGVYLPDHEYKRPEDEEGPEFPAAGSADFWHKT